MMKIAIAAGGTGGHIFPALSVANYYKNKGAEVYWIGRKNSLEEKVAKENNFKFTAIKASGFKEKNPLEKMLSFMQLFVSLIQILLLFLNSKPSFLFTTGGYVSIASGIGSYILRVPLFIHEQNSIPGLANRILSKIALLIFEGFPESFIGVSNSKYVGNPVREEVLKYLKTENLRKDHSKFNILVLGGSQGSRQLNKIFISSIRKLKNIQNFNILHQCGHNDFAYLQESYLELGVDFSLKEFIEDIGKAYNDSDLVISRSGAMTVTEISALGRPCIFLPLPWSTDNHQYKNAKHILDLGGAELVESNIENSSELSELIMDLYLHPAKREAMSRNIKAFYEENTLTQIYNSINESIKT